MTGGIDDDSVLQRTQAGQQEAVAPQRWRLRELERRLLLVVNGETPLGVLLDLGIGRSVQVEAAVNRLIALGLVEALP